MLPFNADCKLRGQAEADRPGWQNPVASSNAPAGTTKRQRKNVCLRFSFLFRAEMPRRYVVLAAAVLALRIAPVALALALFANTVATAAAQEHKFTVGSKRFTESYILGEIITQTARRVGEATVVHKRGLGNTAIVLNALTGGNIDVYPEYTGTIAKEILKLDAVPPLEALNTRLAAMGLGVAIPLGFNNTYALAMRGDDARAKGITRLSDLKAHPDLRLGFSQEFIGRADGWPGLEKAYGLPFETPRGIDHGLAYEALDAKQVDVIDVYSTDAKIDKYGLTVLVDDRNYFPRYDAVLLHRADLAQRLPKTWAALTTLTHRIDDVSMRRMNAAAEIEGKDFATIAAAFIDGTSSAASTTGESATTVRARSSDGVWAKVFGPDFGRLTREHLNLVFLSLAASTPSAFPWESSPPNFGRQAARSLPQPASYRPYPRWRCSRS